MKVLVCGGRNFDNKQKLRHFMERLHAQNNITCVIHGAYRGADMLAEDWAKSRQIDYIGCPAKWDEHDKRAGPIRNQHMLDTYKPDMVVAFPGGDGTSDMIAKAVGYGLKGEEHDDIVLLFREHHGE